MCRSSRARSTRASRRPNQFGPVVGRRRRSGSTSDHAATERFVTAAGPHDILVNNAGIGRHAAFLEVGPEQFDPVMEINVRDAFFIAQAVARTLVKAGRGGSIINI